MDMDGTISIVRSFLHIFQLSSSQSCACMIHLIKRRFFMKEKNEKDTYSKYISRQFLEILHKYYNEKIKTKRTLQQYIYVFNTLCNHAQCDFLKITKEQIKAYFSELAPDAIIKSTNYDLSVLRAVSRYMDEHAAEFQIEARYLDLFSVIDVMFPDMQFHPEDLPDFKSVDQVLAYFKNEGDMVGFLSCSMVLRTTLTTNELVSLERNMLLQDADGNYGIRLKLTDHAYRYVKLPDDIVALINQYAAKRTDSRPSFFLNKKGKAISARALQNRLREACLACGVAPFTYNDLRNLSQALMIKEGAPLDKLAEHINVKQLGWFFRYNRVVEALDDSAVDYSHLRIVW